MGKGKRIMSLIVTYIFVVTMIISNVDYKVLAATLNDKNLELESISGQVVLKVIDLNDTSYKEVIEKYQGKEVESYGNYVLIELDNSKVKEFKEEIKLNLNVEFVEENAVGEKSSVALDELASKQDYIFNTNAIDAWGAVTDAMKKTEIKIAVIDSGIKSTHKDLSGKVDTSNGYNFISNNTNADDDNGHGTNVAGVIAANHNGIGINGIAGQLNVKLLPIKVLDKNGAGTTLNIAKGIKYAADKGASLINISINGKGFSNVINDAIKYAISKGALVVASAGNEGGYADNYWPCNSDGVFVVGSNDFDNDGSSSRGDRVDMTVESKGISTGIISEEYEEVRGTSISAAIATGTMSLVKAKNINYSNDEIKNIVKGAIVSGGREHGRPGLSISEALGANSSFMEIISPKASETLSNDVIVDVLALKPSEVATINYYLNDDITPYASLTGSGIKNYKTTIKYQDLINNINKVVVEITDKSGKTYKEERYFKSSNNSTTLTISVKDKSGNPYKNLLVRYGYEMEALTNDDGEVEFLNIDETWLNKVLITSGSSDAPEKIYYLTTVVGAGKKVIDFSKDSKEVKINALKSDNKSPLSNAEILLGGNKSAVNLKLDTNGSINLITNNSGSLNVGIYSTEDSYFYTGNIDLSNTSRKTFSYDDTVSKVDITNIYDNKIGGENLFLSTSDNLYYGISLNVKNKSAYISKNKYNIQYRFNDLNNSQRTTYSSDNEDFNSNKSISFGKPQIDLERIEDDNESIYQVNLKNNEYNGTLDINTKILFEVIDSSGNKLSLDKDYTVDYYKSEHMQLIEGFKINLINKPKGLYKFKVILNYYGENIQSDYYTIDHVGNGKDEAQNKTIDLKFKLPTELSKIISDKKSEVLIEYQIYDKNSNEDIMRGSNKISYKDLDSFKFEIQNTLESLNNNIYIKLSSKHGGMILDRPLGKSINNQILIDANDANVTKIGLKNNSGLNLDKSKFRIEKVGRSESYFSVTQYVKKANELNFWVDKNVNYELTISSDKLLLINQALINNSNSNITISDDFGKIKFNYQKDSYIKSVALDLIKDGVEEVYSMPSTNVKNEIAISSNLKLINLIYSFKNIGNWIIRLDNGSSYRFNADYNMKKGETKTIDLTNLKVKYDNVPSSVLYNGDLYTNVSLYNEDLILNNMNNIMNVINSDQNNKEEEYYFDDNMSFYNTKGKLIKKIEYVKSNGLYINNLDIDPGVYTGKIDLYGLKVENTGFNINVLENNNVKLRIMDPFDTSKPLEGATVRVASEVGEERELKTDRNGYVLLDKRMLSNSNPIKIITIKDGVPVIFKTPKNIYTKDETIAIPISSIKSVNMMPKSNSGKVSIANERAEIVLGNSWNGARVTVVLDKSGNGKLYTNMTLDNIVIKSEKFTISSGYTGTGDIVFDNVNLGVLKYDERLYNAIHINDSKSNEGFYLPRGGEYYLSPGEYEYSYMKNMYTWNGRVNVTVGSTKELKFGENINNLITTSKSKVDFGEEIKLKVDSKDEYGNKISYNARKVELVVSKNGVEIGRYDTSYNYDENEYRCTLDIIVDNFEVNLEVSDYDGNKITTNKVNFTMDLSNYKKISVKAPNGENVTSGNLIITSEFGANTEKVPIVSGITYLDKSNLSQEKNYSVFGETSKGELVLYGDKEVTTSTSEIKGTSLNKSKFNISLPKDNQNQLSFEILKKQSGIEYYDIDIVYESYYGEESINTFVEKYNNKNIYIDGSEFFIKAHFSNYNNFNEYKLVQVVDNKTTKINLDSNNVSKIYVENIDGYEANSIELGSSWAELSINDSDYVSKDVFDSYKIYVSNDDPDNYKSYGYSKKLSSPINVENYAIKYSELSKLVAETSDNLVLSNNPRVTAKVYLYDNYDNKVSNYNFEKYMNITIDGKKQDRKEIYGSNYNEYFEVDESLYDFGKNTDISYSINLDGKIIESNTIRYTMDLSKFKAIPIKDPLGQPLVSGEVKYEYYKILDGHLYIPNDSIDNLDGYYDIAGFNENGDRIIYKEYRLDKNTKEIKDSTLNLYNINLNKSSFSNIKKITYSFTDIDNYYGYRTDSFKRDLDEIKTSFKYFSKESSYDIAVEAENDDAVYLTSSNMGKENNVVNIDNDAILSLDFKLNKATLDYLYYSLNNDGYNDNMLDTDKKIFVKPNTFYINEASIISETEYGTYYKTVTIKDSFIGNENKTILIGNEEVYNTVFEDILYLNENNSIFQEYNVTDEYGNKMDRYNSYSVKFIGDNYVSEEINDFYTLPSDIKEGTYTIEVIFNKDSDNPIKITKESVKVISREKLVYEGWGNVVSYKLYKSNKEIDSSFNNVNGYVITQKPSITDGKDYRLKSYSASKEYYSNGDEITYIYDQSETGYVESGKLYTNYDYGVENSYYKVNNAISISLYGADGLKIENVSTEDSEIRLNLIKGQTYTVEALVEDISGVYLVNKTFIASNTTDDYDIINFDKSSLKKVTVESNNKDKMVISNLELSYGSDKKFVVDKVIDVSKELYLPTGSYNINMDVINYSIGVLKYNKNIVIGSSNIVIPVWKNISYEVELDKNDYNANEEVTGSIKNFKDSDALHSYLIDNSLKDIKVELMHGDSVIATFNNTLPNSLKGECIIRISGINDSLGKVVSKDIPIVINNNEDILVGDINLDEYVDIFDLVYISKDMDKEKGVDSSFDPRVNLDDSNNKIDIADLAKAAMNYSK